MAQPFPDENVEAHIQGEISGQVAVGNSNIQIGSIHGGVVNVAPSEQQPRLTVELHRQGGLEGGGCGADLGLPVQQTGKGAWA